MRRFEHVFFLHPSAPNAVNGAEISAQAWARAFQMRGIRVTNFYPQLDGVSQTEHTLPLTRSRIRFTTAAATRSLLTAAREQSPDHIIINGWDSWKYLPLLGPLSQKTSTPITIVYHLDPTKPIGDENAPGKSAIAHTLRYLRNKITARIIQKSKTFKSIAVAKHVAHGVQNAGMEGQRIDVVYPPGQHLPGETTQIRRSEFSNPLGVLSVGRLAPQKRPELFVAIANEALRRKIPAVFLWIGGAKDERYRSKLIQKAQGSVVFMGEQAGQGLTDQYQNAHLFTMTSRYEGMPLVFAEAVRVGQLPMIASETNAAAREFSAQFPVSPVLLARGKTRAEQIDGFVERIEHLERNRDQLYSVSRAAHNGRGFFHPGRLADEFTRVIIP